MVLKNLLSRKKKAPKTEFGKNYHTVQIYSRGFEFAFMSMQKRAWHQATTFVYCKDFLHDAIWSLLNKTKVNIYEFKYDPAKDLPIQLNRTALAFRNTQYKAKEEEFHEKLDACQEFLRKIDKKLGFKSTEIHKVPHKEGPCWVVLGDKKWQHAPTMISLYTLLIRVGFHHTKGASAQKTIQLATDGKIKIASSGGAGCNDVSYMKKSKKGIDVILKHGLKVFYAKQADNYPKEIRKQLHDSYGIVNFTAGKPKKQMAHWYRESVWK